MTHRDDKTTQTSNQCEQTIKSEVRPGQKGLPHGAHGLQDAVRQAGWAHRAGIVRLYRWRVICNRPSTVSQRGVCCWAQHEQQQLARHRSISQRGSVPDTTESARTAVLQAPWPQANIPEQLPPHALAVLSAICCLKLGACVSNPGGREVYRQSILQPSPERACWHAPSSTCCLSQQYHLSSALRPPKLSRGKGAEARWPCTSAPSRAPVDTYQYPHS